jgi:hypothetical protein
MSSCEVTIFPYSTTLTAINAPLLFQEHAEEQGKSVVGPVQKQKA